MKKYIINTGLMVAILATNAVVTAQNTFPSINNAGIGITAPAVDLHIVGNTKHSNDVEQPRDAVSKASIVSLKGELIVSNEYAGATAEDGFKISQINSDTYYKKSRRT